MLRRHLSFTDSLSIGCSTFSLYLTCNAWYTSTDTSALRGNGVVAIRREDKNQWERRVPISPSQVAQLSRKGVKVLVQPSSIRCFTDQAYQDAGAVLAEDLSPAGTILSVKEVPAHLLIPERTYLMFSHTIKAQAYNMPLLDSILEKSIRLIDYEKIVDGDGRMVKFGPYAGFAGMIDTLHALGVALLTRGYATPFLHISLSKEYPSLDAACADLARVGAEIQEHGLPTEVCPLTVVVTGAGSVSHAVQQILHRLPVKYVSCAELPALWKRKRPDRHALHVCIATASDMVRRKKDATGEHAHTFSKTDYYRHPHKYESIFHEEVMPYTKVLVNGMYWEPKYPKLLTLPQAKQLKEQGRFPLLALGDITCDPQGSVELLTRSTSVAHPFFAFDVARMQEKSMEAFGPEDVIVLGVDHLPAEFPKEASHEFGKNLVPLIEKVAWNDGTLSLEEQKKTLGAELFNAVITSHRSLTPNYAYITELRKRNTAATAAPIIASKKVLVIGGGMCAGPAVEVLLRSGLVCVTVVDTNRGALDTLLAHYTKHTGKSRVRDVVMDVSSEQERGRLMELIQAHDVVISLLPAFMHTTIVEMAIECGKHIATASYIAPEIRALGERAKERGVAIVVEMGLDPGIDIMTSKVMLNRIRSAGGIVRSYKSACGALLQPENSNCPLAYKFSWSPRGVLSALARPARVKDAGSWRSVPSPYEEVIRFGDFSGMNLVAVANGDAEDYATHLFGLGEETQDIARLTLRYGNFPPAAIALNKMGLLSESTEHKELGLGGPSITWLQLIRKLTPQFNLDTDLDARTKADFTALGLLSDELVVPQTKACTPRDSLSYLLANRLSYASHERDMVLMVHEVIAEYPNQSGGRFLHRGVLSVRGKSALETGTGVTVGAPLALAVLALLKGQVRSRGLVRPTDSDLCTLVLDGLKEHNIEMHEEDVPLNNN